MRVRYSRGFTLIEVMVSIVVLAIGILGLAPLMGIAVFDNSYSSDVTNANGLAEQSLESLLGKAAYGALPDVTITDSVQGVYQTVETVEDNSVNASVPNGVYKISVVVAWTDQQGNSRQVVLSTFKPKL